MHVPFSNASFSWFTTIWEPGTLNNPSWCKPYRRRKGDWVRKSENDAKGMHGWLGLVFDLPLRLMNRMQLSTTGGMGCPDAWWGRSEWVRCLELCLSVNQNTDFTWMYDRRSPLKSFCSIWALSWLFLCRTDLLEYVLNNHRNVQIQSCYILLQCNVKSKKKKRKFL